MMIFKVASILYAIEDLISGNKKIMFNNNVVICIIETDQIVKCLEFKNSPKMDKIIKLMKYYSNDVEQIKEFDCLGKDKMIEAECRKLGIPVCS